MRLSLGSFPFLDFLCENLLEDVFTGGLKILATNSHGVQELVLLLEMDLSDLLVAVLDHPLHGLNGAISCLGQVVCPVAETLLEVLVIVMLHAVAKADRGQQEVGKVAHLLGDIGALDVMAQATLSHDKLQADVFDLAFEVEVAPAPVMEPGTHVGRKLVVRTRSLQLFGHLRIVVLFVLIVGCGGLADLLVVKRGHVDLLPWANNFCLQSSAQ